MNQENKPKRCPQCGAVIPSFSIRCPECGFTFSTETDSSANSRSALSELQDKLLKAKTSNEKALLINAFAMPNTKEALLQLLVLSYTNFSSSKGTESEAIRRAWLSKALQSYKLLEAQSGNDADILKQLKEYAILKDKRAVDKLSGAHRKRIIAISVFSIAFVVVSVFVLISLLKNPVQKYADRQNVQKAVMVLSEMKSIDDIQHDVMRLMSVDSVSFISVINPINNGEEITTYYKNGEKEIAIMDKNGREISMKKYDKSGVCIDEWEDELDIHSHLSKWNIGTPDILYTDYRRSKNTKLVNAKYNENGLITSITLGKSNNSTTYTIEYNEDQEKNIIVTINLSEGKLIDNNNFAKLMKKDDGTRVGHWGNGDYQCAIYEESQLDYLITLIRQSYETNK